MRSTEYMVTWQIRRTFKLLAAYADDYLSPYGISAGERAVLEYLDSFGPQTVPDLARSFHVTRQNIQVRVNSLTTKKLVSKRDNPSHKRSPNIDLTEAGKAIFNDIKNHEGQLIDHLFEGLTAKDIGVTSQTLSHLIERLDRKPNTQNNDNTRKRDKP